MTDYTLDTLVDTADLLLVRLTPPSGGEMQSTRIAFLPGGYIVIHGDLCPGANGLISNVGYGPRWFWSNGGALTPRYMAEKFRVPDVFIPAQAADHLRECARDKDDLLKRSALKGLAADAEGIELGDLDVIIDFLSDVEEVTGSPDHAETFYGPDPDTMDLLIRIQAAFARLYVPRPSTPMEPR